jgi:uncharacterized protein YjbI with pentapeptide repeats
VTETCRYFDSDEWDERLKRHVGRVWDVQNLVEAYKRDNIDTEAITGKQTEHVFELDMDDVVAIWRVKEQMLATISEDCPHEVEEDGLCIFHLPVEEKDDKKTKDEFLEKVQQGGKENKRFVGTRFGRLNLSFEVIGSDEDNHPINLHFAKVDRLELLGSTVRQAWYMNHSIIAGASDFRNAEFDKSSDFKYVKFGNRSDFRRVGFRGPCFFSDATFQGESKFRTAELDDVSYFNDAKFIEESDFEKAEFGDDSYFGNTEFKGRSSFLNAKFKKSVQFVKAKFRDKANYRELKVNDETVFDGTIFGEDSDFSNAQFEKPSYFIEIKFRRESDFSGAKFGGNAHFSDTEFVDRAIFEDAEFRGLCDFSDTEFRGPSVFLRTKFRDGSFFNDVNFREVSDFRFAKFKGVNFGNAIFYKESTFWGAVFQNLVEFNDTIFMSDVLITDTTLDKAFFDKTLSVSSKISLEGATIREGRFTQPEGSSTFYDLTEATVGDINISNHDYFNHFRFYKTDFDGFDFTDYKDELGSKSEIHEFEHDSADELEETSAGLEATYLKAKDGAKKVGDHELASKFFIKEIQYRREKYKDEIENEELERKRRAKLEFDRGINWLYEKTSGYGEKPIRVILTSFFVVVFFMLLYPLWGIRQTGDGTARTLSYASASAPAEYLDVIAHSFYFSSVTFTTLGYGDMYPVGLSRILSTVQSATGALLIALLIFVFGRSVKW